MKHTYKQNRERGAAAIFTVMIFTLMITVVTIGFLQIMLRDQMNATNDDLSRSALDSAESGVEDAKRLLARQRQLCAANPASTQCTNYTNFLATGAADCDALSNNSAITSDLGLQTDSTGGIQVSDSDELAQGYSCLGITMDTANYENRLNDMQSDFIPLRGTAAFDSVQLSWFRPADAGGRTMASPVAPGGAYQFPAKSAWNTSATTARPSLMRVQLLSIPAGSFNLGDLDTTGANASSRTLFLYPTSSVSGVTDFARDVREFNGSTQKNIVVNTRCSGTDYSCVANLAIPASLRASTGRQLYLRVTPLYAATTFDLQLRNGATPILLDDVQPIVDSTGRANDVFRRIAARIRTDVGQYPVNVVESSVPICKDVFVTGDPNDYGIGGGCPQPAP